ncbi:MAG: hypothetical protein JXX28_16380 [Deltaproteobacteria bacterium]|nr:hypothetical protein [Deltaproteobacteria bacterium]
MGIFDGFHAKVAKKSAELALERAAGAVKGAAEGLLSSAEGRLAAEEAARKAPARRDVVEPPDEERGPTPQERARAELEALKERLAAGEALPAPERPDRVARPLTAAARREAEAAQELARLKEARQAPPGPVKKTL